MAGLVVLLILSLVALTNGFNRAISPQSRVFILGAREDSDATDMKGISGMKGYYRRPSRAIEKGGGFYVPGLEGERIRIITACALVLMYVANRAGQTVASQPQIISELTGLSLAILLFVQGAADVLSVSSGKAPETPSSSAAAVPAYLSVIQSSQADDSQKRAATVAEAVARSVVQTSPDTNYVVLLQRPALALLELGPVGGEPMPSATASAVISAFGDLPSSGLAVKSRREFEQRLGEGVAVNFLPEGAQSVALALRPSGLWLVGCSATQPLESAWLAALLDAPIV